ncbi:hypothetical protein [Methylotenera sp. N17]|uniref:hypothetical protein n=1 Tax=Methylotenera sp. N17 TaxID=1502761 RepID=UPI0006455CF7|nr:hypothetical protein [Methylotenera sp. N17]
MSVETENEPVEAIEELDLEDSANSVAFSRTPEPVAPVTKTYNHQQHQESFRGWIAILLIILLAIIVIYCLCFLSNLPQTDADKSLNNLIQILQVVFGPLVTLVATAVGYYFGANSKSSND